MSITDEIKRYAIEDLGVDIIGFAPAAVLNNEAKEYRAIDILPGAETIIVFGKRMTDGAIQAAMRKFEDGNTAAESLYSTYAAELCPNMVLFFDTFNLSQYIERSYHRTAVPLPCGPMQNGIPINTALPMFSGPDKSGLPLNIAKAAYSAGLGEFGWSGHFLTPEFGPRIQLGAILTNLKLEYGQPYSGPKLCEPEKCGMCSKICPTGAIAEVRAENQVEFSISGGQCRTAKFNRNKCSVACMRLSECSENPSDDEIAAAMKSRKISDFTLDHYPKLYCDKCLIYCQAGDWEKHFVDRGLSNQKGRVE